MEECDALSSIFSRQLSILDPKIPRNVTLLIVGTDSVAVEIARSLLMAARFDLVVFADDPDVQISYLDLGCPYISEKDVGRPRLETIVGTLQLLYNSTGIEAKGIRIDDFYENERYQIKILSETRAKLLIASDVQFTNAIMLNKTCRMKKIPFGIVDCAGLLCRSFFDWGPSTEYQLRPTGYDRPCEFRVLDTSLEVGCGIILSNSSYIFVKEMAVRFRYRGHIIGEGIATLHSTNSNNGCFIVEPASLFDAINKQIHLDPKVAVMCEILPVIKVVQHITLEDMLENLDNSLDEEITEEEMFDSFTTIVHSTLEDIHTFIDRSHNISSDATTIMVEIEKVLQSLQRLEHAIPSIREWTRKAFLTARGRVICVDSYIANWMANEVIKFMGKRYLPNIKQIHARGFIQVCHPVPIDLKMFVPTGSWLDGPRMALGSNVVDALGPLHLVVVGAGALGCEDAKNLVALGVGLQSRTGCISYLDDDHVSLSNPTRQFCFTEDDAFLRRPKAEVLKSFMMQRRSDVALEAYVMRFASGGHPILQKAHAVITSPDSDIARFHCLIQCMLNEIPYFNAGTDGLNVGVNTFIPGEYWQDISEPLRIQVSCQSVEPPPYISSTHEVAEYALQLSHQILYLVNFNENTKIQALWLKWKNSFPNYEKAGSEKALNDIIKIAKECFQPHLWCSSEPKMHAIFDKDCPKHMKLANTIASILDTGYHLHDSTFDYNEILYAKTGLQPAIITSTAVASAIRTINIISWVTSRIHSVQPMLLELRSFGGSQFQITTASNNSEPQYLLRLRGMEISRTITADELLKMTPDYQRIEKFLKVGFMINKVLIPEERKDEPIKLSDNVVEKLEEFSHKPPTFLKYQLQKMPELMTFYVYVGMESSVTFARK